MSLAIALALAAEAAAPICTDRPTKANATCTVPAGRWQVETSPIGWSRTDLDGARLDVLAIGASTVKAGIGTSTDLQIAVTPYVQATVKAGGATERRSGIGDTVIRVKHRLTASDAAVQAAIIPFIKLPTARRGIGNRKLEGGLAVPISFTLARNVTMTFGPEVDVLADGDGRGRHLAVVNLANIAIAAAPRLTIIAELWSNLNFDPDGTVRQASADAALAYALSDRLQLDAGVNVGLTRETPDVEAYVGVSTRF